MSLFVRMVKFPPYCGLPSLSHQFPLAVVVVAIVVGSVVVVSGSVVVDVVFVVDVVEVAADVDTVVDLAHDASNMAATSMRLKPNQITLLFKYYLQS